MFCKNCEHYVRIFKDGMDNICGLNREKIVGDKSSCKKFSKGTPHESILTLPSGQVGKALDFDSGNA
jgi:hypothetical protein